MIEGYVTEDGEPVITVTIAGREWIAIIDSGFNGDLELPAELQTEMNLTPFGPIESILAGGQFLVEESYFVEFRLDGTLVRALATFVAGEVILIGTRLLQNHILTINFPANSVQIERATGA